MWNSKLPDEGFLSFKFSFTKNHQKWLQNSRFLLFLGKKDKKSQKFHKKPKFCIVFAIFFLYFKILNFELLGQFWMIFWSQFLFFGFLEVKNSKTEKIYKRLNFLCWKLKQSYFVKFFSFWIFDPQKAKKRKLAPENHAKMTQDFKIQKLQVK